MPPIEINRLTAQALESGTFEQELPEFYALKTVTENGAWHINQNVFTHVIKVIRGLEHFLSEPPLTESDRQLLANYLAEKIDTKSREDLLIIATLLHDIAKTKTLTTEGERAFCPNHEAEGAEMVADFKERFNLFENEYVFVEQVVRNHGKIHDILTELLPLQITEALPLFKQKTSELENYRIELLVLIYADVTGSDFEATDSVEYNQRLSIVAQLITALLSQ